MDLKDALDRSFGDGPPAPNLDDTIRAGRGALRRRRAGSALAAFALVAAAGGTAYAIAPRGDAGAAGPVTSPTIVVPTGSPSTGPLLPGEVVRLRADGSLVVVQPGAVITRRVPNPLGLKPPSYSTGAEVRYKGQIRWYLVKWIPGTGSGSASVPARQAFPTLEAWLTDQVALERGDPTLALVRFGANGRLQPLPGVTMLEQRANPQMPPRFAPDDARTAVAKVRWHGAVWYVLARQIPAATQPEFFPTAASVSGQTIDQFLDYARPQYDTGGEGLR